MTDWAALAKAVREAHLLGCTFYVVGADIEIVGAAALPERLRAQLQPALLRDYFGAEREDNRALDWLDTLGAKLVVVTERAAARATMAALSGAPHLGLDTETAAPGSRPPAIRINADGAPSARQAGRNKADQGGLDPHRAQIVTAQLFGGGSEVYVFRDAARDELLKSRWLREQHLVCHSAAFDLAFLRQHAALDDADIVHPVDCSLQATGLLYGVWNRSLADAMRETYGVEPPKVLQTSCWAAPRLSAGQLAYAASDAVEAWFLWDAIRPILEATGRLAAYELQRDAIPAVVDMQLRGLGFDPAEHACQVATWARELAQARRDYLALTGKPAPTKPDEVRAWVAEVADTRLERWPRTASGTLKIERKHLKRLLLTVPSAKPVLAILAKEKLLSTYGTSLRGFINPLTGRIHCSYNLAGAKSGRFTASKPNLQQLPAIAAPTFRKCLVAAPGNLLVGGDFSQIELRAAAWLYGDPALTAVYEEGRDLHAETAALISGVPVAEIGKDSPLRAAAKPVNFGSIYGIGARSLAEDAFDNYGVDMSEAEAREALDRFFATFHVLHDGLQRHADLCQRRGFVEIGCGRIVKAAWEPGGHLSFPQCCNLPVQGAAADAMLRALPLVFQRLHGLRAGLIATVHDELLIEAAEADADAVAAILQDSMTEAFEATFPGAPSHGVVAVKVGKNWSELKD